MPTFAGMQTPNGHLCGDVASALQKSIRRGEERQALYWASELDLTGYGNYVWKRLRIMASEDVGLADPMVCVQVKALYDNWVEQSKNDRTNSTERRPRNAARIFLVHAVILLARAQKSRLVDHAVMVVYYGEREPLEVPDHAFDKHTAHGRRRGRGWAHFFEVASHLENRAELVDEYEEEAREVQLAREGDTRVLLQTAVESKSNGKQNGKKKR